MLGRLATLLWNGTIATLISGSILPAGAEEAAVSKDNTTSPQLIGYLIDLRRTADIDRENYLQIVMENFRSLAGKDRVFDRSDVDLPIAASRASYRAAIVERIMSNDLNADGEVTEEELRRVNTVFPSKVSRDIDGLVRGYLKVDRNGDGSIDTEEAYSFASERELPDSAPSQRLAAKKLQLIALDRDGDGRLEADEVDASARATFAHYDLDGDGRLVEAEVVLWRGLLQANGDRPKCIFPKLTKDDRVVVLVAGDTHTLSDVSIAGPDVATSAHKLVVRDGGKPLYVVALGSGMIWQLTGSIDRVERFVATSQRKSDKRGGTGVAGLDAGKVSFVDTGCFDVDPAAIVFGPVMTQLVGRDLDEVVLASGETMFRKPYNKLGEGSIGYASGTPKPYEEYSSRVDRETYADFLRFNRGGVARLDPAKVVSEGPVESYRVLPQEAGLLQLLDDGSLVRAGHRRFRIVKPIERFPPGLAGAHSVQFTLAKGIPMPKGNPGHSSVKSEETGEMFFDIETRPMSIHPFDDLRGRSDGRF